MFASQYLCGQSAKLTNSIKNAESEFHTFEFVICKFNVVYMNMLQAKCVSTRNAFGLGETRFA